MKHQHQHRHTGGGYQEAVNFPKKIRGGGLSKCKTKLSWGRLYTNAVSLFLEDTRIREASCFQQTKSWISTTKETNRPGKPAKICVTTLSNRIRHEEGKRRYDGTVKTTLLRPRRHQHTQSPAPFLSPVSRSHSFPIFSQNPCHRFLITAATNTSFREFSAYLLIAGDLAQEAVLVACRKWKKKTWYPPIV